MTGAELPRIVLIDDSPDDRSIAIRELRKEFPHCDIIEILNAESFDHLLNNLSFDLVVVDYELKWSNGLNLLTEVLQRVPNVPIIMYTASGNQEIAVEAMKRGAADYVVKSATNLPRVRFSARNALEKAKQLRIVRESERLAVIGRLMATVSHEINNPLQNIRNILHILSGQDATPEQRELAKAGVNEVARIEQIANRTLGYYRESPWPISLDLATLLNEVLFLYSKSIEAQHISVIKQCTNARFIGFPGEMKQMFANLLSNAIDAMPRGGTLDIVIGPSSGDMKVTRIRLCDTGSGIPAEYLPKIFDPFFTTKGEKGSGLGLWIVRGIVEKYQGSIHIEIRNPGTCVIIDLHASSSEAPNEG